MATLLTGATGTVGAAVLTELRDGLTPEIPALRLLRQKDAELSDLAEHDQTPLPWSVEDHRAILQCWEADPRTSSRGWAAGTGAR